MDKEEKIKPGRQFYVIGLIMIIVSIIIVVSDNSNALNKLMADSQAFTAPGQTELIAKKTGRYDILFWRETNGHTIPNYSVYANMKFTVRSKSSGKTISTILLSQDIHEFDATPGTYLITAAYSGKKGPSASMRVVYATQSKEGLIWGAVFFVLAAGGLILLVNTAVHRRKNLKNYYLK